MTTEQRCDGTRLLNCPGCPDCRPPVQPAPVAPSQSVEEARGEVVDVLCDVMFTPLVDALIKAVRGEQEAAMNVMSSTFADVNDSRFEWKARAEAAEAQLAALLVVARALWLEMGENASPLQCWKEFGAALTTPTSNEVKP